MLEKSDRASACVVVDRIDSDREADGCGKKSQTFIHGCQVDMSMVFQEANPAIERCSGEGVVGQAVADDNLRQQTMGKRTIHHKQQKRKQKAGRRKGERADRKSRENYLIEKRYLHKWRGSTFL